MFTPAITSRMLLEGSPFGGGTYVGKNPPAGAIVYYWLKTSLKEPEKKMAGGDAAKAEAIRKNRRKSRWKFSTRQER